MLGVAYGIPRTSLIKADKGYVDVDMDQDWVKMVSTLSNQAIRSSSTGRTGREGGCGKSGSTGESVEQNLEVEYYS
ncbi:hypothetical protein L195_g050360 [Trifolium pratense]|uniref:Uncharacterized protein n=1 Tax=Trifolium pratense TaxID=57577 RepID=A0A2K3JTI4_TRIPR|nr:hypothetical protein L195_g050360 [Trifolium pratense]